MENLKKNQWWNKNGNYKILHKINPIRINFISKYLSKSIKDHRILDIGCGGGLMSEPFSLKKARVTGIDENLGNLNQAKKHAKENSLNINYKCISFDNFYKKNKIKFDLILCLEVIEHVQNYKVLLEKVSKILKPGGVLVVSTINRNLKSLVFAKFFAEYVLNWIPIGTHEFKNFLKPEEITKILENEKLEIIDIKGMVFNPIMNEWILSENKNINYFIVSKK